MEVWQIIRRISQGVIRRRKRLALLTFFSAFLIFAPLAYFLSKEPPRFQTGATILLESSPNRLPLFQEFSPFRPLPVQLAILQSRSLAESVIDNLQRPSFQDLMENSYYVDYSREIKNAYLRLRGLEPEVEGDPRRRALSELQNGRVTFNSNDHGIVKITAQASRPQVAVDIANTYIEVLVSRTRSFNIDDARVSREFLEQQLADIRRSFRAGEEALRNFTVEHGGIRIPEQSLATVARLSQTENALAEVQAGKKIVQTRLQGLREKLESQKQALAPIAPAAPPRVTPPGVQRLRDQLAQFEGVLLDLRTKYTEEHPRVVLAKDRIAEIQRQIGNIIKETTPLTPAPGAVPPVERIPFAEQVVAIETSFYALAAQEEALRKQVEALRQSLSGLSQNELEYSRLVREVDSNRNLYALLSDKLAAARIREQGDMKVVKVIDPATPPTPAQNQKRLMFVALAVLLATAFGSGVPAAIEWFHGTIETGEDVRSSTGLPVLTVLPRTRSRPPLFTTTRVDGRISENFIFHEALQNLRVAIQFTVRTDRIHTLLITSPLPSEGKSTVVVNLGLALREAGRRVVLVDADLLRPTLHRNIKVKHAGGVVDALHSRRGIVESLSPAGEGMWIVPRGEQLQPTTRGMLATSRLKELLDDLSHEADLVLCDSSPVLLVPDTLFLATAVDAVILVAKAGSTSCNDLARTKALLEGVGAKILGVIINEMPISALSRYYRYYKSYARG